jgi:hypothetical protein
MIDIDTDKMNLTHGQKQLFKWLTDTRNTCIEKGLCSEIEALEVLHLMSAKECQHFKMRYLW